MDIKIAGFQKLTLLDYPGKVACTAFTIGCNYRCPFCHNSALVLPERFAVDIRHDHLFAFLKKRIGVLEGVCITGGEPTLHSGLRSFIQQVKDMGYAVKLDTNGSNPCLLTRLMEEGLLDYVAMDIKNTLAKYPQTVGISGLNVDSVVKSTELLLQKRIPFEFRTTLVREYHTPEDIREIGRWLQGAPRYILQSFVDSGDLVGCEALHPLAEPQMRVMAHILQPYMGNVELRGV
ncbi:MAG: anaerobic ribonucleoside-triphosphate reductase activating protein [Bacillota bacterium]|nr:anaerobic ribonucleoside-triphosphate reductase activating protein [Bacillota bacterium]